MFLASIDLAGLKEIQSQRAQGKLGLGKRLAKLCVKYGLSRDDELSARQTVP